MEYDSSTPAHVADTPTSPWFLAAVTGTGDAASHKPTAFTAMRQLSDVEYRRTLTDIEIINRHSVKNGLVEVLDSVNNMKVHIDRLLTKISNGVESPSVKYRRKIEGSFLRLIDSVEHLVGVGLNVPSTLPSELLKTWPVVTVTSLSILRSKNHSLAYSDIFTVAAVRYANDPPIQEVCLTPAGHEVLFSGRDSSPNQSIPSWPLRQIGALAATGAELLVASRLVHEKLAIREAGTRLREMVAPVLDGAAILLQYGNDRQVDVASKVDLGILEIPIDRVALVSTNVRNSESLLRGVGDKISPPRSSTQVDTGSERTRESSDQGMDSQLSLTEALEAWGRATADLPMLANAAISDLARLRQEWSTSLSAASVALTDSDLVGLNSFIATFMRNPKLSELVLSKIGMSNTLDRWPPSMAEIAALSFEAEPEALRRRIVGAQLAIVAEMLDAINRLREPSLRSVDPISGQFDADVWDDAGLSTVQDIIELLVEVTLDARTVEASMINIRLSRVPDQNTRELEVQRTPSWHSSLEAAVRARKRADLEATALHLVRAFASAAGGVDAIEGWLHRHVAEYEKPWMEMLAQQLLRTINRLASGSPVDAGLLLPLVDTLLSLGRRIQVRSVLRGTQ